MSHSNAYACRYTVSQFLLFQINLDFYIDHRLYVGQNSRHLDAFVLQISAVGEKALRSTVGDGNIGSVCNTVNEIRGQQNQIHAGKQH